MKIPIICEICDHEWIIELKPRETIQCPNCKRIFNLWGECATTIGKQNPIEDNHGFSRSVISPTFAKNFIKTYIINPEGMAKPVSRFVFSHT